MKPDQQRVKELLTEAITMLCRSGLNYKTTFSIEGLLGVTLDEDEVFLINIKETSMNQLESFGPHTEGDKLLVNGTSLNKNVQCVSRTDIIPVTSSAMSNEHLVTHTYSATQRDRQLAHLVIKEEHISESECEKALLSPKHHFLSDSSNTVSLEQPVARAKAELIPGCTAMWEAQSVVTATTIGYPVTYQPTTSPSEVCLMITKSMLCIIYIATAHRFQCTVANV